jgi:hypothetical protein
MKVCLQEMLENLSRVEDDSLEADEHNECEADDVNTPDQFEDVDDDEEQSENVCVIGLYSFIPSFYFLLTQNVAGPHSPQVVIELRCLKIMASIHNGCLQPEELLNLWWIPNNCFHQE